MLYQQKYHMDNIVPVLMGLVYFDEAEGEPDPLQWKTNWQKIKRQFAAWVRKVG